MLILSGLLWISCAVPKVDYGPDKYVADPEFKVVGYLYVPDFEEIDQIELDRLTYLNLAFVNPDAEGNLAFTNDTDVRTIIEKGHEAGLKVLMSLGGGGSMHGTDKFWRKALKRSNRSAFVADIVKFVENHNLDGVDVDIEWNLLPTIDKLYTPFVVELRDALHAKGKAITTALHAVHIHPAVTRESLAAYDFINVMVYDRTGPWNPDKPGPHSPMSYVEESYVYWTEVQKIQADRLVLGMPFYGWNFDPPEAQWYRALIEEKASNAYVDSVDQVYYNGIPTIVRKTTYAREKLGGVMFWQLAQDKYGDDLSLLRAVDQTLKAGDCQVKTFFRDEDGDGFGDLARPFQACEAPTGYVANGNDSNDADAEVQ